MPIKFNFGVFSYFFFIGFVSVILLDSTVYGVDIDLKEPVDYYRNLKDPLRMAKLNVLWEKARKKLSEPKLKMLISELKVQDKEELTLKKLKASGGDKEGLKEAELRKSLMKIIRNYALERNAEDSRSTNEESSRSEKAMFKDKKLHKLWIKAEQSGLTQDELKTLKEEFEHHQTRIDEYYSLIERTHDIHESHDIPTITNDVHHFDALENDEGTLKDYYENINTIREKHREIKNGYSDLHKKATSGPKNNEFTDPKVAGLWKLALRSHFDAVELESLHTELKHYEARLHKLTYLSNEFKKVTLSKLSDDISDEDKEKILSESETEGSKILKERLEKQQRKINKLHDDLEYRIMARHSEL